MAHADRQYDKTQLFIDTAEERGLIHRDYIAHCFRWSHVVKFLQSNKGYASARIIDAGCGKGFPLAKTLYSNKMSGAKYLGVDLNALDVPPMILKAIEGQKLDFWKMEHCDLTKLEASELPFVPNIATSFEAAEHMHPRICRAFFAKLYEFLEISGHGFFSTPIFNGSAANNHVNEMGYKTFGAMLEDVGFVIQGKYGTFASMSDYMPSLQADGLMPTFNKLREYYDSNALAVIMAPLYPQHSRNVLWHVVKVDPTVRPSHGRVFDGLQDVLETDRNQHHEISTIMGLTQ